MLKAFVIAAALATAGAGAVYAQKTMNDTTTSPTQRNMGTGSGAGTDMGTGTGTRGMQNRSTTGAATTGSVRFLSTLPANPQLVSNWYDKNVYDPNENKLGEIQDMMMDGSGKIDAVIVSVGGFLGIGEKDIAVPFDAIKASERNNKWWLTMNTTKDELKNATGFKFDRSRNSWSLAYGE